jgi:serine/threonine protein kinase
MTDHPPPTPLSRTRLEDADGVLAPKMLAKLKVEIEGFEVLSRLGSGGQATVYKARQIQTDRLVAIKVLHAGPHASAEARARLHREVEALRAIKHPGIVQAIGAGRTKSGLDCLVMNFIDGRPLDALWTDPAFAESLAAQADDRLRLFKRICETVQAAHAKGITHRDLSPSNILIDGAGAPHILDFGMATSTSTVASPGETQLALGTSPVNRRPAITVTGQFLGKLQYASPEQARSAGSPERTQIDATSDVYALGVLLYQMLTGGAFPYEVVGNYIDVLHNIIHSAPRPPRENIAPPATVAASQRLINDGIEAIVLKALEKAPENRYASAGELAADLGRYLAGQPTIAHMPPRTPAASAASTASPYATTRPAPSHTNHFRRRAIAAAASLILVATLIGVSMNVKTIALWLGLSVVAPIVPTELAPLATTPAMAAEAALVMGDETETELGDLAADLARVEARLKAVNQLIKNSTNRPADDMADGAGLLGVDDFVKAIVKAARDHGHALDIAILDAAAREADRVAEEQAGEANPDAESLLVRRSVLDQQQTGLWARLSWGTYTGRPLEAKVLKYKLETPADANPMTMTQLGVIEKGVRVCRTLDAALTQAAARVREGIGGSAGSEQGGESNAGMEVVFSAAAGHVKGPMEAFRSAIDRAKDQDGRPEEDVKALRELDRLAGELSAALSGAATGQSQATTASDEPARRAARARLQRDLRLMSEHGARLETKLVERAKSWNATTGESTLPEVRLMDAVPAPRREAQRPKPTAKPSKPGRESPIDLLEVGDAWEGTLTDGNGTHPTTAIIESIKNDTVIFKHTPNYKGVGVKGDYGFTIVLDGTKATPMNYVSYLPQPSTFKVTQSSGSLIDGRLRITIEGIRIPKKGEKTPGRWTVDIRTLKPRIAKEPEADPAPTFTVGDKWSGTFTNSSGAMPATARVKSVPGDQIEWTLTNQYGDRYFTLEAKGDNVSIADNDPKVVRPNGGQPNRLLNIKVEGKIDEGRLRMSGTWSFTDVRGNPIHEAVSFDLTRER